MKINLACIIDDDEIYVYGVKCIMNMVDFTKDLIVFENGEDALNYFKPIMDDPDAIPDVILLDINMPIMDGWQFLDEFRKEDSSVIVPLSDKIHKASICNFM